MGGNAVGADDPSLPLVRLRHAWVSAAWPGLGNLSVLVGQTWGIVGGPYFAQSLSHLADAALRGGGLPLPARAAGSRLGRASARRSASPTRSAALAPFDRAGVTADAASGVPGPVGERAGVPNVEARLAGVYRPARKARAELGVSGHYGKEKFSFPQTTRLGEGRHHRQPCVRARFEARAPVRQLAGGAFSGENLDILDSVNAEGRRRRTSPRRA